MGLSYSGLRVTFSGCGGSARDQRGRRGFTGVESGAGTLPGFRTDSSTLECRLVLRLTDACISIHRDTSAAEASSLNAGFFVTMARVRLCVVRCQFGIGCLRRLPSRSGLTENRVVTNNASVRGRVVGSARGFRSVGRCRVHRRWPDEPSGSRRRCGCAAPTRAATSPPTPPSSTTDDFELERRRRRLRLHRRGARRGDIGHRAEAPEARIETTGG